jgi:hypothetical protein
MLVDIIMDDLENYLKTKVTSISIDINFLIENSIPIEMYLLGILLREHAYMLIHDYVSSAGVFERKKVEEFIERGLFEYSGTTGVYGTNNLAVTDKFIELTNLSREKPSSFIDEWYSLWPSGIKSGGYYVRSGKPSCEKKLQKFMNSYEYNKDVIMDATKRYIDRMKIGGYSFMKLAPYFIEKDGVSILAGECEEIINSKETLEQLEGDGNYGFAQNEIRTT